MHSRSFGLAIAIGLLAASATQAVQTKTYGWEDGSTLLGTYPYGTTPGILAEIDTTLYYGGTQSLKVVDNYTSGTPQGYVAWVQGLNTGDQVTASFWCYDTTPGTSPSGRIWAHYTNDNGNIQSYAGSASGSTTYSDGNGWSLLTYTWTFDAGIDRTGLVIEVRTYSNPGDTVWIDDLEVTAPDTATDIFMPNDFVFVSDQTIVTSEGAGPTVITLQGAGEPPLTYTVDPLEAVYPTVGINTCKVYDNGNNADLTLTGGTLSSNGNEVRFEPGDSGLYALWFYAENSTFASEYGLVLIGVQDSGQVVITEIMHRPNNYPFDSWEWLEIKNIGGSTVTLDSILTPSTVYDYPGNLSSATINSGDMKALVLSTLVADWLTEWNSIYRPGAALVTGDVLPILSAAKPPFYNDDVLFLMSTSGELLDAVSYRNGAEDWPPYENGHSVFLAYDQYTTTANDAGANWSTSWASANNTYETDEDLVNPFADSDQGSPLLEPGGPTINPPDAWNRYITLANDGATHPVELNATPMEAGATITGYKILSGPTGVYPTVGSGGVLVDPGSGTIGSFPHTLSSGNIVNFVPSAAGMFSFLYRAIDSNGSESDLGEVTLYVQAIDQVIITEVMYNSANQPDNQWEWIEIYNPTGSTISLNCISNLYHDSYYWDNLSTASIAPGEVKILAPDLDVDGRTQTQFNTEWANANYNSSMVIWVDPAAWPYLSNDGLQTMRLFAAGGELLDAVTYSTDSPWPRVTSVGRESIIVKPTMLGTVENDGVDAWAISVPGELLAWETPEDTGDQYTDSDVGSPTALPLGYPFADDATYMIDKTAGTLEITLAAADPESQPLTFTVGPLTAMAPTTNFLGLTLTDPNNGNADVTAGGTLAGNTGRVDLNLDGTRSGYFAFGFTASDGTNTSNTGTVELFIQDGSVIVTEIMYNPSNTPDNDWEWVEITNNSGADVTLGTMQDNTWDSAYNGNAVNLIVPDGSSVVLAKGDVNGDIVDSRSGADFLTEWSPLASALWIAEDRWPSLDNGGDAVALFTPTGDLLDIVEYDVDGTVWPVTATEFGSESIYLTCDGFDVLGNDNGANWALSADGVDGAYATPETPGGFDDIDVGSPAIVPACAPLTAILSRNLYYNNSYHDGYNAAIQPIAGGTNHDDDLDAIDTNKAPLMVGDGQATFANWTGSVDGITGLMYEIQSPTATPVVGDFTFTNIGKTGTGSTAVTPDSFLVQPTGDPSIVQVFVTFTGVTNCWLEVTIGTGFGLATPESHWWGNARGDSGSTVGTQIPVNATDELAARNNPSGFFKIGPTNIWDYNKDGSVNATDQLAARNNPSGFFSVQIISR